MKEQFVTYEIAQKLKELGFDEECLAYYAKEDVYKDKDGNKTNFVLLSAKKRGELVRHGSVRNFLFQWLLDKTHGELYTLLQSVAAPLWQQVIDWFETSYDIEIMVKSFKEGDKLVYLYSVNKLGITSSYRLGEFAFDNRHKAREQAILKAIELCKQKK